MEKTIETVELAPDLWPDVETLFGPRGAAAGCWCQWVLLRPGEKLETIKGKPARARFKAQIESRERTGILAYRAGKPVGWLAFGPRVSFPKLDRSRVLACDDAGEVWSVGCFFVPTAHRRSGVATALLAGAVTAIGKRGGRIVEGYPNLIAEDKPAPGAFVWTGTPALFAKAGFSRVDGKAAGRIRMRLALSPA